DCFSYSRCAPSTAWIYSILYSRSISCLRTSFVVSASINKIFVCSRIVYFFVISCYNILIIIFIIIILFIIQFYFIFHTCSYIWTDFYSLVVPHLLHGFTQFYIRDQSVVYGLLSLCPLQ